MSLIANSTASITTKNKEDSTFYTDTKGKLGSYTITLVLMLLIFTNGGALSSLSYLANFAPLTAVSLTDYQWENLTGVASELRRRKNPSKFIDGGTISKIIPSLLMFGVPFSIGDVFKPIENLFKKII